MAKPLPTQRIRPAKPEVPPKPGDELQIPDRPHKRANAKRGRNPRKAGGRLRIEDYELLVEGYRRAPGNHREASKFSSVPIETAKRTWFYGLGAAYEFGQRPIRGIVEEEQVLARAEVQRRHDAERAAAEDRARRAADPTGLASRELPASKAEAARRDAINARTSEAALVRGVRSNALAMTGIVSKLLRGSAHLAKDLEERLEKAAAAGDMPIDKGVLLIKRVAEVGRITAQVAETVLEAERMLLGDSDSVPDESTMTAEEAIAVLKSCREATDRAEAMGWTVHQGGASPHKPGQLPSWDDAPGGPLAGQAEGEGELEIPDYDALEGEEPAPPSSGAGGAGASSDAGAAGLDVAVDDAGGELPVDADEAW